MDDSRAVVLAVDIGGTRIKAALVDQAYTEVVRSTTPTPPGLGDDLGLVVEQLMADLLRQAGDHPPRVVGCGLVTPGIVDDQQGIVITAVNLGWRHLPVRDVVARSTGLPTALGHDVRAGLRAEAELGVARGVADVAFVPIGTGIAAALQVDGVILSAGGWAGEAGAHGARPSGSGVRMRPARLPGDPGRGAGDRQGVRRPDRPDPSALEIAELARTGDPAAVAVWTQAADALARGLSLLVAVTGVELVVLAGGLAESGDLLLAPLRRALADERTFGRPVRVERALLGERAGVLGAALLAWAAAGVPPER